MERSTSWPVLRRGPLSLFLMLVPSLSSAAGPTDDTEELCSSQLIPVTRRVGVSETPTKQGPTRPGCLIDGNSSSAPPRPVLGVCVFNRYRAFLMTGARLQSDLCGGQLLISWAHPGWDCGFLQRERTCAGKGLRAQQTEQGQRRKGRTSDLCPSCSFSLCPETPPGLLQDRSNLSLGKGK